MNRSKILCVEEMQGFRRPCFLRCGGVFGVVLWKEASRSGGLTGPLGSRAYHSSRGGGGKSKQSFSFPFLFAEPAELGLRAQEKMLIFSRSPRMQHLQDRRKKGVRVALFLLGVLVTPGSGNGSVVGKKRQKIRRG